MPIGLVMPLLWGVTVPVTVMAATVPAKSTVVQRLRSGPTVIPCVALVLDQIKEYAPPVVIAPMPAWVSANQADRPGPP